MRAFFALLLLGSTALAQPPVLTLDDAIRIARAHHPNVEAARAQLEAAQARLAQARAGFIPGLTGGFAYQPQTANFALTPGFKRLLGRPSSGVDSVVDTAGNTITAQCVPPLGADGNFQFGNCQAPTPAPALPPDFSLFSFFTANLGLYWTAFDWGHTYYGYRSAKSAASAQALNVHASEADVVLNVELAYYGTLAANAAVGVAVEAVATMQKHLDQAQAFFEVGAKTKIDVASAESDLANAKLTLARAKGALDAARAALLSAIGEDTWRDYTLIAPPEPPDAPTAPEDQLFSEALKARPELGALRLQAKSLGDAARSLRGSYLPALTLQLGPTWAGTDLTALTTNFSITVALSYPLTGLNPFFVQGQVREARASERVAVAQERAERNQVRLETAQARAALESAREAVRAALELVNAARERRDLAEGRYQAGVGSILELSDAEFNFVNAELQQVQAALSLDQARAQLDHALGRL